MESRCARARSRARRAMFSASTESLRTRAASRCFCREKNDGSRIPGARCGSAGTRSARPDRRMASALSLYAASRSACVGTRAQISAGMRAFSESSTESMMWRVSGADGLNPRGARTGPAATPFDTAAPLDGVGEGGEELRVDGASAAIESRGTTRVATGPPEGVWVGGEGSAGTRCSTPRARDGVGTANTTRSTTTGLSPRSMTR